MHCYLYIVFGGNPVNDCVMGRLSNKTNSVTEHVCGECTLAHEVQEHWNRALDGHYICVRCPHSSRSRLKSEQACEYFKNKSNL